MSTQGTLSGEFHRKFHLSESGEGPAQYGLHFVKFQGTEDDWAVDQIQCRDGLDGIRAWNPLDISDLANNCPFLAVSCSALPTTVLRVVRSAVSKIQKDRSEFTIEYFWIGNASIMAELLDEETQPIVASSIARAIFCHAKGVIIVPGDADGHFLDTPDSVAELLHLRRPSRPIYVVHQWKESWGDVVLARYDGINKGLWNVRHLPEVLPEVSAAVTPLSALFNMVLNNKQMVWITENGSNLSPVGPPDLGLRSGSKADSGSPQIKFLNSPGESPVHRYMRVQALAQAISAPVRSQKVTVPWAQAVFRYAFLVAQTRLDVIEILEDVFARRQQRNVPLHNANEVTVLCLLESIKTAPCFGTATGKVPFWMGVFFHLKPSETCWLLPAFPPTEIDSDPQKMLQRTTFYDHYWSLVHLPYNDVQMKISIPTEDIQITASGYLIAPYSGKIMSRGPELGLFSCTLGHAWQFYYYDSMEKPGRDSRYWIIPIGQISYNTLNVVFTYDGVPEGERLHLPPQFSEEPPYIALIVMQGRPGSPDAARTEITSGPTPIRASFHSWCCWHAGFKDRSPKEHHEFHISRKIDKTIYLDPR